MKKIIIGVLSLIIILLGCNVQSENTNKTLAHNESAFDGYIILGRPTDSEITARIIAVNPVEVYIEYGEEAGNYSKRSDSHSASRGNPADIVLNGLKQSTKYYYRLLYKKENLTEIGSTEVYSFTTARASGEAFSFAVQSDSHLLNKADRTVYQRVMESIAAGKPDFFLDLGDTFLNDKDLDISYAEIDEIAYDQVPYFSVVAKSSPLFLVIGNHEGEYGYLLDGTKDNMSVYAAIARKQYFPNPVPNEFYSGNSDEEDFIGQPQNYYAYTWGDALFVVLDPYRYTKKDPAQTKDNWDWTLGDKQYQWLKKTLENSDAKYKFVFAHHAIGNIRGGAEVASLYEWGGKDKKGIWLFYEKRPGWEKPIHQLMVDNDVTIFFQGHDHLFAREEVDGVIYQTMPKPAEVEPDSQNNYASYSDGDIQINSGYLEVSVNSDYVQVDYNRVVVAGQPDSKEIGVVYSYTVDKEGIINILKRTDDSAVIAAYENYQQEEKKKVNERNRQQGMEKETNGSNQQAEVKIENSGNLHAQPVLGRPTDRGITISTAFDNESVFYYKYGAEYDDLNNVTAVKTAEAGSMQIEELGSLQSDTKYYYQLLYKDKHENEYNQSKIYSFITQREEGADYTFLVEADPHLDEKSDGEVYESVLSNMAEQDPDFIIDLGDASMAEKLARTEEDIIERNILLRSYWDNLAHSIPFYMVIGNHDGEAGWNNNGTNSIGEKAKAIRRTYFPNPLPNTFYSGLGDKSYSFTWGDALFVVLDPFTYTAMKPKDDNWEMTLGKAQYDWLSNVLKQSDEKYKFVFVHNLVGGVDINGRGGAKAALLYEWGGKDSVGTYLFDKMRPGWEMPVHKLLKENGVDIVFHGHDHFFAYEELDGVVYQLVPQPSLGSKQNIEKNAEEYGYEDGVFLPSPGYLRIKISPESARIDFLHGESGKIAHSYSIKP